MKDVTYLKLGPLVSMCAKQFRETNGSVHPKVSYCTWSEKVPHSAGLWGMRSVS